MFGSNVLEVATGIVFIYILLSLLCSTINEQVIVRILSLRAQVLLEGIMNMLGDPTLVKDFYDHPLINALSQDKQYIKGFSDYPLIRALLQNIRSAGSQGNTLVQPAVAPAVAPPTIRKPSYIPANLFALALKDVLSMPRASANPTTVQALAELEGILKKLNIDLEKDLIGLEVWFDSTMDRVSGWYKRRVQIFIFVLGLIAAFSLNIDTISLVTTISHDTTVRATLVSAAQGYTTQHDPNLNVLESNVNQVQPLVGWYSVPDSFPGWLLKIIGLLATTFAVSLGAPFWFDVLNKFVSVRSSGPQPPPGPGTAAASTASRALQVVVKQSVPPAASTPQDANGAGQNVPSAASMPQDANGAEQDVPST